MSHTKDAHTVARSDTLAVAFAVAVHASSTRHMAIIDARHTGRYLTETRQAFCLTYPRFSDLGTSINAIRFCNDTPLLHIVCGAEDRSTNIRDVNKPGADNTMQPVALFHPMNYRTATMLQKPS